MEKKWKNGKLKKIEELYTKIEKWTKKLKNGQKIFGAARR